MSKEADREEIIDAVRDELNKLKPEQLAALKADLGDFKFRFGKACEEVLRIKKDKASKVAC